MAKLDPNNSLHKIVYGFLEGHKEVSVTFDKAGDVLVADLRYWNKTDIDNSKNMAQTLAWGFHGSCIMNAKIWKCTFIGPSDAHAKNMSAFISTMQDPAKKISDIAGAAAKIFQF